MFRMKRKLEELNKSGKKIRVELVGIGKMGRVLLIKWLQFLEWDLQFV